MSRWMHPSTTPSITEAITFTGVEALADALRKAAGDQTDPTIVINADAKAPHQSVINMMEAARLAGYGRITFTTRPAEITCMSRLQHHWYRITPLHLIFFRSACCFRAAGRIAPRAVSQRHFSQRTVAACLSSWSAISLSAEPARPRSRLRWPNSSSTAAGTAHYQPRLRRQRAAAASRSLQTATRNEVGR